MDNDLEKEPETCFDIPATQGPRVLALLVEIDPLAGLEPDEQRYQERTEWFCQNLTWRRVTGNINPGYVNLIVERMFTPDELADEVGAEVLQNLKYRICQLYFK